MLLISGNQNMRTMLISLRPEVFENIASGAKIYEHRKVFPNEPIKAYIYVSRPVQAITGQMILTNKTALEDWLIRYKDDKAAVERIKDYMTRNKFAMEIQSFQKTSQIPLSVLRENVSKFIIPQMYYFLDETEILEYIENNLIPIGEPIFHSFEKITSDMICRY